MKWIKYLLIMLLFLCCEDSVEPKPPPVLIPEESPLTHKQKLLLEDWEKIRQANFTFLLKNQYKYCYVFSEEGYLLYKGYVVSFVSSAVFREHSTFKVEIYNHKKDTIKTGAYTLYL